MSDRQRATLRNQSMGFVFQFYHLLPELTALENVMLPGLLNHRQSRRSLKERAQECLHDVGLQERASHKPAQLSGGELQRVAIARALINRPQLVFCDEPTGNLDSDTGERIADLLMQLHRAHRMTLVLVTHEESLAHQAHRCVALRDGQIVSGVTGHRQRAAAAQRSESE